jgi:thymidylate synthase (FAD)
MDKIEVKVIYEPTGAKEMAGFLARLTQRGHNISTMDDLLELMNTPVSDGLAGAIAKLPHGTIKRFTPITVAIVGASRRFLAQARTHQVGITYVSASLQYSDYSGLGKFVVPYELFSNDKAREAYLNTCEFSMNVYADMIKNGGVDNDTAGYAAPQGLRNILIMSANHEAWGNFIRARACNRNTVETQYVALRIWEELLKTKDGEQLFSNLGPDCISLSMCREGKFFCGESLKTVIKDKPFDVSIPRFIIDYKWPLLNERQ